TFITPIPTYPHLQCGGPPSHGDMRQLPDHRIAQYALAPAPPAPIVRLHRTAIECSSMRAHMLADDHQPQLIDTSKHRHIRRREGRLRQEDLRERDSKFGHSDSLPRSSFYPPSHASMPTLSIAKSRFPRLREGVRAGNS